jgi:hypothetical protein
MPHTLENRLGNLMHEIKEIKKELILQKIQKASAGQKRIAAWKILGKKVTAKWDTVSALQEISLQRGNT